jgi:hypothetical protein
MVCLIALIMGRAVSIGRAADYKNDWIKYADDRSTSYSIDKNSIVKNESGNYWVLILMVPYKNNVFNRKFNRSDIAYVYFEMEVDIANNLYRITSAHAYSKEGTKVLSEAYSLKGNDVPPLEKITEDTVMETLKKYIASYVETRKEK